MSNSVRTSATHSGDVETDLECTDHAIVTHSLFPGIAHALFEFLSENASGRLLLVEHSFSSASDRRSKLTKDEGGEQSTYESLDYDFLPEIAVYLKDFVYGYLLLLRADDVDVIYGLGGFNALCALLVRLSGGCDTVVFYTIDYTPDRFDNALLNRIYHGIDRTCVRHCDEVWNVSPRIEEGRSEVHGIDSSQYEPRVVPVGVWEDDIADDCAEGATDDRTLVFVGTLLEKQGVQLVLRALPDIVRNVDEVEFRIIGDGEYRDRLEELSEELAVADHVQFVGSIHDSDRLNQELRHADLAVAPYQRDSFTYYADPTKLKTYAAQCLPVLVTDVPHNASVMADRDAGQIIEYSSESIATEAISLLTSDRELQRYADNARQYVMEYTWKRIFSEALHELIAAEAQDGQ